MPRLRAASVVLAVASSSILSRPSITSGFLYAGIGARIEGGSHDSLARQHPREGLVLQLAKKISSMRTPNECCADLLQEEDLVPRAPDGTVQLPASCLEPGASCKAFNVYGPSPARSPSADINESTTASDNTPDLLPAADNATESDEQADINESTTASDKTSDLLPAADNATESDEQVNHPDGSGVNVYENDYDAPQTPTTTNDGAVDTDVSSSEDYKRLLMDPRYNIPSVVYARGWIGYMIPHFSVGRIILGREAEGEAGLWGGHTPLLLLPRPEKVFYEDTTDMSKAMTVVASQSPVVQEINIITIPFTAVYGLDEAMDVRLLRMLVGQNDQAAPGDSHSLATPSVAMPAIDDGWVEKRPGLGVQAASGNGQSMAIEDLYAVLPTVDLGWTEQAASGDGHPMAIVDPYAVVMIADDGWMEQSASSDGQFNSQEEDRAVPAIAIDVDNQTATGDRHPTPREAADVPGSTTDIDVDIDKQVDRGSMWATELIDRAKGAERRCAVGSAPLNDTSQRVPIRASIVTKMDDGRPSLAVKVVALLRRVWSWVTTGVFVFVIVQLASLSYSATFPLRVGGKVHPRVEYMAYWRRFLAVAILRVRAKRPGDGRLFRMIQVVLCVWIWQLWGTCAAFGIAATMVVATYVATRPSYCRCAVENIVDVVVFKLICDYLDVKLVGGDDQPMQAYVYSHKTCIMAQFPLSISNTVHDMLGVRRPRTCPTKDMVVDGREGVAVIKGGPEEPVVRESQDKSALTRQVVSMACAGQDSVIPMYVFGASRTHELLPGCESKLMKALACKLPGLMFRGVFGLVSYRQQLTVVLGRPIKVSRATFRDVVTQRTCVAVEEEMAQLASKHRPEWDKRESLFTRGPISWS